MTLWHQVFSLTIIQNKSKFFYKVLILKIRSITALNLSSSKSGSITEVESIKDTVHKENVVFHSDIHFLKNIALLPPHYFHPHLKIGFVILRLPEVRCMGGCQWS